jgi:hypothetical protein
MVRQRAPEQPGEVHIAASGTRFCNGRPGLGSGFHAPGPVFNEVTFAHHFLPRKSSELSFHASCKLMTTHQAIFVFNGGACVD